MEAGPGRRFLKQPAAKLELVIVVSINHNLRSLTYSHCCLSHTCLVRLISKRYSFSAEILGKA